MSNKNLQPSNASFGAQFSSTYPRPFSVTLLVFGVLTIAGINLYRCIEAILQWRFLAGLLPALVSYIMLSGLFWSLIGLPLAWSLWRGNRRAPQMTLWIVLVYITYYWLDRLLIRQGSASDNLPFTLGFAVLVLAFVFWTLSRPVAKAFFDT